MISKFVQLQRRQILTKLNRSSLKAFSTSTSNVNQADQYQTFEHDKEYTPVHKVSFQSGKLNIFDQASRATTGKYTPYELKESTMKNLLGIFGTIVLDFLFHPGTLFYSGAVGFFSINWVYTIFSYMNKAITKMDLHEDGKSVTITFKNGSTQTVNINNIAKKRHEKELVQTFEECYLFPISIRSGTESKTYYLYGQGQESIKNGEIFRAIINGQTIRT